MYQPTSVTEACAELARLGEDAKVYAGGTGLILLLRLGLVQYTRLVDVKRVPELDGLAWDGQTLCAGLALSWSMENRTRRCLRQSPSAYVQTRYGLAQTILPLLSASQLGMLPLLGVGAPLGQAGGEVLARSFVLSVIDAGVAVTWCRPVEMSLRGISAI